MKGGIGNGKVQLGLKLQVVKLTVAYLSCYSGYTVGDTIMEKQQLYSRFYRKILSKASSELDYLLIIGPKIYYFYFSKFFKVGQYSSILQIRKLRLKLSTSRSLKAQTVRSQATQPFRGSASQSLK